GRLNRRQGARRSGKPQGDRGSRPASRRRRRAAAEPWRHGRLADARAHHRGHDRDPAGGAGSGRARGRDRSARAVVTGPLPADHDGFDAAGHRAACRRARSALAAATTAEPEPPPPAPPHPTTTFSTPPATEPPAAAPAKEPPQPVIAADLSPVDQAIAEKLRELLAGKFDRIFDRRKERTPIEAFY